MRERKQKRREQGKKMSQVLSDISQYPRRNFEIFIEGVGAHKEIYPRRKIVNGFLTLAAYADALFNGMSPEQARAFLEKGARRVTDVSKRKSSRASEVILVPVSKSV